MKVLLKQVKIFNEGSKWHNKVANVLISNDLIEYIGSETKKANKVLECKGMTLSSGWVDVWADFSDPGFEHKEDIHTGKLAARSGGFTKVCTVPNTSPTCQSKNNLKYLTKENGSEITDILPIAAVTKNTEGSELNEMLDLHENGAVAFSDGVNTLWNPDIILKTLLYLQKVDGLVVQKPEDKMLSHKGNMHEGKESTLLGMPGIPVLSEEIAVQRDLKILNYVGGKLHFTNISTPEALRMIGEAKKEGLNVSCDINISQVIFSDEDLSDFDTSFKVNPPLRSKSLNKEILKYLKNGTIDLLSSAHLPQDSESKNLEFDFAEFGMISLQTFPALLNKLSKSVDFEKLLPLVTSNPRKLLKLDNPIIENGEKAELTLFDPNMEWTLDSSTNHSKSKNTPLWNMKLTGGVRFIVNNGKMHFNEYE